MDIEKVFRYDRLYLDIAKRVSAMSYARRQHVGCVIVKDDAIISHGWNGMPKGMTNDCETTIDGVLTTKPVVIHAEENALLKVARSNNSTQGACMYLTCAPCLPCAKMAYNAGIIRVVYEDDYFDKNGILHTEGQNFLSSVGVFAGMHKWMVELGNPGSRN